MLDLSGRERVPTNPIINMRHPWHPWHPIVGLRSTRAQPEGGNAQRGDNCGCTPDFLHVYS